MADPVRIQALLKGLQNLGGLKELFWSELNYDREDQPLPVNNWTSYQREGLVGNPILFASGGNQADAQRFEIIHTTLKPLNRVKQREILPPLIRDHPFALFVFSDEAHKNWHFVNVKDGRHDRPLIRRITVAEDEQLRTASQRIAMLDLEAIPGDLFGKSLLEIQKRHNDAFDVEAVTREFFRDYRRVFEGAEAQIGGLVNSDRRLFTQRLFNRLMFIRFLERKGWLTFGNSRDYLQTLWRDYTKNKRLGETFYTSRLFPLFFAGLNNTGEIDIMGINKGGVLKDIIGQVPYLNGGLFEETETDRSGSVPDEALEPLVDGEVGLFYRFNFTVTESTPFDIEVAVDPEMLGKIFEELVTGRHESGSYYTPKAIVSFMGREAIRNYLQVQCPKESDAALSAFIDRQDAAKLADPEGILEALKRITICDPACGSGAYLLGMMQELLELRRNLFTARHLDAIGVYKRKLEIIQSNLYGVDIDQFAVNITRLRLWLSLIVDFEGDKPLPLPNLDYKVEVGNSLTAPEPMPKPSSSAKGGGVQLDLMRSQQIAEYRDLKNRYLDAHGKEKKALHKQVEAQRQTIREWVQSNRKLKNAEGFDWAVEFTEVFTHDDKNGGFDVIVANPPYVRQELIKDQKPALKSVYGDLFTGTADLFVYFYFRALQLLRHNGVLAFISSNKWMRAGYGEKLRETLSAQTTIKSLIDFGDLPVFGAIAYPCVIVAQNTSPHHDHSVKALNVDDLGVIDQLVYAVDTHGWQQPQNSLDRGGWALMQPDLLALLEKLKKSGKPLGEYVNGAIYRGIVTGFNEAFVIDAATRDRLIAEDAKSAEIIKPYLRGRDIKRWRVESADLYVIFTRRGVDIERYQAIRRHLTQYRMRLIPGGTNGRKPGPYKWWEIQDNIAYYREFDKPKIVWPDIAKRPEFAFDRTGAYGGNTMYIIPVVDYYFLGILNSNVMDYYYNQISSTIRGDFLRFIDSYVRQIPIPTTADSMKQQIEAVVLSLLDVKGQGSAVPELEARLNALVYQAYGLTDTEIALIEAGSAAANSMEADPVEVES
ncbi:Modification methylase PaeR7I [Anaerolineae bacterium]|nr:Modification methylase PaeR7I [Anaerolineae bacterium]